MKTKKFYQRALSFVIALAMIVTVFGVAAPTEIQAADKSFDGKKKTTTVTISDTESLDASAQNLQPYYIPYKAKNTGTVTLKFQSVSTLYSYSYGNVRICDKSKKPVGAMEYWNTGQTDPDFYTRTYGVKKGQTYLFYVVADGGVKITASFKAVKKVNATKKTKAKEIRKGKTMTGVIIAGDKKADWYKIKMKGNKKLKLSYTVKTNGMVKNLSTQQVGVASGIRITFYDRDGNPWTSTSYNNMTLANDKDGMDIFLRNTSTGSKHSIKDGTYYIKVEPINTSSSGQYTIKWKTY